MLRRLFCLFSAFAVLFFCSVPAFATGVTPSGGGAGIPIVGNINFDVVDFFDSCNENFNHNITRGWNFVNHLLDEDVCIYAPTAGGGHSFVPKRTMVDGQIGKYYVCEYCGRAYGEMLEEKYEEYVDTLPGQTVNSDGAFIWRPAADFSDFSGSIIVDWRSERRSLTASVSTVTLNGGDFSVVLRCYPGQSFVGLNNHNNAERPIIIYITVVAPFDATYVSLDAFSGVDSSVFSGSGLSIRAVLYGQSSTVSWPAFQVMPLDTMPDFSVVTRVSGGDVSGDGNIGLYGYVQDGQLYQSTVGNIYNETTNIYQNPVTGETKDVSNWTYDYSDRSYTLNTEEGDTVTVTYGDTNVTINDGGTTYNVYYLAEHEDIPEHDYVASVTLEPTCTGTGVRTYTCTDCGDTYTETIPAKGHSYQSAVTLEPSCVNTGVRTFTCSECGDVYTVSIPATGHTWEVVRTVPTTFDEDGQLLQEGYTLYQCSVCGEQYKITADTGGSSLPSPSSGGTSTGEGSGTGLIEIDSDVGKGFLATIAHGLTEDLPEVLGLVSQWFTNIPKLYDGYSKFLAASFAWMPPDCVMLLTFGVGMVVALAICRAMFRR